MTYRKIQRLPHHQLHLSKYLYTVAGRMSLKRLQKEVLQRGTRTNLQPKVMTLDEAKLGLAASKVVE